jgi:hypothetical protein
MNIRIISSINLLPVIDLWKRSTPILTFLKDQHHEAQRVKRAFQRNCGAGKFFSDQKPAASPFLSTG